MRVNGRRMRSLARTCWRPLAHVAVRDEDLRRRIGDALRGEGWAVVDAPSGYHLLQRLAGLLLAEQPWRKPHLVVVEAVSPGCSGITIAQGLRELGWSTPVVLLVPRAQQGGAAATSESSIRVTDEDAAVQTVLEVARSQRQVDGVAAEPREPQRDIVPVAASPWDRPRATA